MRNPAKLHFGGVKRCARMQDMKLHLEKLLRDAAECRLISALAIGRGRQGLFA
jgi:hypothetical protein